MAGHEMPCPACGVQHVVPTPENLHAPVESDALPTGASSTFRLDDSPFDPPPLERRPSSPVAPPRPVQGEDDEDDGEFELRKFDRESDEMDLTPMVDCVFLLLIFFMITASFTVQKTIEVPPPDPEKRGATQSLQTLEDLERTSVVVQIDERNSITVDDVPLADPSSLADVLRDKMYQEQKNELVIEAHADAFHETVIAVVDAANEVQFQKIRLATTPGSDSD
jgi:biopolymer transport protein ExbD